MTKPNIIFIMSDEHDPAVTGCYGDPLVQTPNLDRLASQGVTFDSCYCNSPLCVPSRLSFTSGKYISRVGAWNNECKLPSDTMPSLPRTLRQFGMTPYLCGKQHYASDRRYGFEDLLPTFNRNTKKGRGSRLSLDEETCHKGKSLWERRAAEFYPGDNSRTLDHDRTVTERAIRFLQDRPPEADPYFLFAGYVAPHFPLIAPNDIYQRYKGQVPLPDLPEGYEDDLLPNYEALRQGFGFQNLDPGTIQYGRDLYWALTDWFDREVGRLLDAAHQRPDIDNTIIIYTSDHGENKGDHGLWWKNCHYESSARIPLLVSWPAQWNGGQRRSQVCSLLDVVQTVVELSGGSAPDDWDGDSLVPLLNDPSTPWKDYAVSEYYAHHIVSGMTMIRKGEWKYIYHSSSRHDGKAHRELYNLKEDPKEFRNLADHPQNQEQLDSLHALLVQELGEDPEAIEQRCLRDLTEGYPHE